MKKLIEKIREMKGVVTVEPAGEDMAVVVFEPKDERELRNILKSIYAGKQYVECTNEKEFEFVKNKTQLNDSSTFDSWAKFPCICTHGSTCFSSDGFPERWRRVISFSRYIQENKLMDELAIFAKNTNPMSEDTARRLLGMFSKKTLKAEDLVDGEIYVMQAGNTHIFRAYTLAPADHGFSCHYSYLCGDTFFSSGSICIESNDRICRKATTTEKQTIIKKEVKNGYFHELNK